MDTLLKCRRTACNNEHDCCKHSHNGDLYCRPCAAKINQANPQIPALISTPTTKQIIEDYRAGLERILKDFTKQNVSLDKMTNESISNMIFVLQKFQKQYKMS